MSSHSHPRLPMISFSSSTTLPGAGLALPLLGSKPVRDVVGGVSGALARIGLRASRDVVEIGRARAHVVHLLGHTPGSVALVYEGDPARPHVFSGDSLFPGGIGNTEKDPLRFGTLLDDVERKIFGPLPDETWVYPGHGADTTLGTERPHLDEWRERGW